MATKEATQSANPAELKSGATIYVNLKGEKTNANFQKMSPDGTKFQAKVAGHGYEWFPISALLGLRQPSPLKPISEAKPSSTKSEAKASTGAAKGKAEADEAGKDDEAAAAATRAARLKEKADKRAEAKAEREKLKAAKAEKREKAKAERANAPKKSRGKGVRLKADVLGILKEELPLVSTEEGDQRMGIVALAEMLNKRDEDIEKAVALLVEDGHVKLETVDVPADGENPAFSYQAVSVTAEGRSYVKPTAQRAAKEAGEKKVPMQQRIADLIRQFKTNDEIIEELSTKAAPAMPAVEADPEKGIEAREATEAVEEYTMSKNFISTVRTRMKDPELYGFKYATADDVDRDYLAERKVADKKAARAAADAEKANSKNEEPAAEEEATPGQAADETPEEEAAAE